MAMTISENVLNLSTQRCILEKIKVNAFTSIPMWALDTKSLDSHVDRAANELIIQMEIFLAGNHKTEVIRSKMMVQHYATWWDMFKDRYFSKRMKRWFPIVKIFETVNYDTSITNTYICPHIEVPSDNQKHIDFVVYRGNRTKCQCPTCK